MFKIDIPTYVIVIVATILSFISYLVWWTLFYLLSLFEITVNLNNV